MIGQSVTNSVRWAEFVALIGSSILIFCRVGSCSRIVGCIDLESEVLKGCDYELAWFAVVMANEEPVRECRSEVHVGHISTVRIIDVLDLERLHMHMRRLAIINEEGIAPLARDDDAAGIGRIVDGDPLSVLLEPVLANCCKTSAICRFRKLVSETRSTISSPGGPFHKAVQYSRIWHTNIPKNRRPTPRMEAKRDVVNEANSRDFSLLCHRLAKS